MNIFGSCVCPSCELDTRFLLETGQDEHFYLLGDQVAVQEDIKGETACDYCQHPFVVQVVCVDQVISDFLNEPDYVLYQEGTLKVEKATEKAGLQKEYKQELKQFHESFVTPFDQQPFSSGTVLTVGKNDWTVQKVYKKEGTETDLTKRLVAPTLDEYWYEVVSSTGEKKWCIVTDTHYERLFLDEATGPSSISAALQEINEAGDWFEFENQEKEEAEEHNAILTIEAPFVRTNEQKFDVTDSLFQTSLLFEKLLTDNLFLKAYQYLAGVRLFVVNKENELEMDLFGENVEILLDLLQEHYSISADE